MTNTPTGYIIRPVTVCERTDADMPECTCCKTTLRTAEEQKKLLNRLNRIEGQIRGIRAMVERDAYCPDILIQVSAATSAPQMLASDRGSHCTYSTTNLPSPRSMKALGSVRNMPFLRT